MSTPNVVVLMGYVPHLSHYENKPKLLEQYKKAREFYGSKTSQDYVQYVHLGSKEKLDFVNYSGNSEKSSGVFNEKGLLDNKQIKYLKQTLKSTKSVIWHGVISFKEEFGNTFCNRYEQAYELMKREFPKFFKNAGLDEKNIGWFAGLHENTDNRHIHFLFYEKEPKKLKRYSKEPQFNLGKMKNEAIEKFKLDIELNLTHWSNRIAFARKELTTSTNEYLENNLYWFRKDLFKNVKNLMLQVPLSGRISYDSENMQKLKPLVDEITNKIIKQDESVLSKFKQFMGVLGDKEKEIKALCENNKTQYEKYSLINKYTKDIYRRIGDQIIYNLKMIKIRQHQMNAQTVNRLIKKRIEKSKLKALIKECVYIENVVKVETVNALDDFLHKLENSNYKRLIEEGLIVL